MKKWCLAALIFVLTLSFMEVDSMKPMQKEVLYPTVRVECTGVGSGVVIYSEDGVSLVLTAAHVLTIKNKCRVTFYPDEVTYPAEVVHISDEHDLGLVRIEAETPCVAKLPETYHYKNTSSVWKVGCGAGHDPFVTRGHVGDSSHDMFMHTAPVVGGDSGGGVYARKGKRYVLVGITVAHAMGPTGAVHHVSYAHNLDAIHEFLSD